MAFVRLYSGSDGESHFEDADMAFAPAQLGPLMGTLTKEVSRSPVHILQEKVKGVVFGSQTVNPGQEFHPVGQAHYVVTLSGMGELETGTGETRRVGPGDVLWDGDTTGRGHRGRVIEAPWVWVALMLEE